MDFKLISLVFKIFIVAIIWIIIFYLLKIMYYDIKHGAKNGNKGRETKKSYGLEVIQSPPNSIIKNGAVIPVDSEITIGRASENALVLEDKYTSSNHARIFIKNGKCFIEDLKSTNGTFINENAITDRCELKSSDEIRIGLTKFKVL